ncbi:hypothetical protein D9M71_694450 [compost metagenome]
MFARAVHSDVGDSAQARTGACVHNDPASLGMHLQNLVLHAVPDPLQIDVQDTLAILRRECFNGAKRPLDTGVVNGNVNAPPTLNRCLNECLNRRLITNINCQESNVSGKSRYDLMPLRFIGPRQHHSSPSVCKKVCSC